MMARFRFFGPKLLTPSALSNGHPELNQGQRDGQANGREQREDWTGGEGNETGKHERVAGEVETAAGECPHPLRPPVDCHGKHNNGPSPHESTLAGTTAVELPPNDTVPVANDVIPGECNPPPPPPDPPPPIRNTAQTHQVNPIKIRSDEHDEEHDKRALALVVTDAVELLNNGSIGAVAAAACAAATATKTPPSRTLPTKPLANDTVLDRTTPPPSLPSELNHPHFLHSPLPMLKTNTPISNPTM